MTATQTEQENRYQDVKCFLNAVAVYEDARGTGMTTSGGADRKEELAKRIASHFQNTDLLYRELAAFFRANFGHLRNTMEASDSFQRYSMYDEDRERVQEFWTERDALSQSVADAGLYLSPAILQKFQEYSDTFNFFWTSAPPFYGTYYNDYFVMLIDPERVESRERSTEYNYKNMRRLLD